MSKFKDQMIREMTIRGLQETTKLSYLKAVSNFKIYVKKELDEVILQDIKDYQYYLLKERLPNLAPRSVNNRMSGVKFLYRYVFQRHEYTDAIPRVKAKKFVPTVLSADEMKSMIDSVYNVQYKAILMTLYSCGLRASELLDLRVDDIDSKRMLLRVRGKNNKERFVVLSPILLQALRTYWCLFRANKINSNFLFIPGKVNHRGKPGHSLSNTSLDYIIQAAVKAAGIKKKSPLTV